LALRRSIAGIGTGSYPWLRVIRWFGGRPVFPITLGIARSLVLLLVLAVGAMPALAFETMIALDGKARSEAAGKSEFTSRDATTHEPIAVNLRGKTLDSVKPGDVVDLNGKPYTLTSITQELQDVGGTEGIGIAVAAIIKFKQWKSNPQQ
jgi:hypothetical protein